MVPKLEVESVRKVCQLTGEFDRERHAPAFNRTQSRFGLFGTDLGSTFEHEGKLWFLFGDTWPTPFTQCGGVAAVSRSKEHMEVWGVDENGLVRSFWYWNGWQDSYVLRRSSGFAKCAGIASVSRAPQHMEIFAVGEHGALEGKWFWEDEWKDWYTLEGASFSQTAGIAAVSRTAQHMEVFVVGEDGFIRGKWFWDGWKDWYTFDDPRLSQTAGLAAVSRAPQHMELFVVGEDGFIRGKWFWDGWKDWYELGGGHFSHTAGIAAVSRSPEHMEIFLIGEDGLMRGKWFWNEWKDWYVLDKRRSEGPPVEFSQTARVAAVSRGPDHMELFAVGLDGRLWHNWFDKGWSGWDLIEMCSDSVAWTEFEQPEPGIRVNFISNDGLFRSPHITGSSGEAIKTGCLEVPIAGLSSGNNIYVLYSTDHFTENKSSYMGRSVFCRALGGDPTDLRYLYELSDVRRGGRFINVAFAVVHRPLRGLEATSPVLLAWGSGGYRQSDVYLGAVPLSEVEHRDAWKFCTNDVGPTWDQHESNAKGLLGEHQVGELSVSWVAPINAWLMLYNAANPRGILARVSREPWGPWSEPSVLFNPRSNGLGYGHFMHDPAGGDQLSDPGREYEVGGEYGPYVINRYTKVLENDGTKQKVALYFVLSTWNPYNTVLMQAIIALPSEDD